MTNVCFSTQPIQLAEWKAKHTIPINQTRSQPISWQKKQSTAMQLEFCDLWTFTSVSRSRSQVPYTTFWSYTCGTLVLIFPDISAIFIWGRAWKVVVHVLVTRWYELCLGDATRIAEHSDTANSFAVPSATYRPTETTSDQPTGNSAVPLAACFRFSLILW